MGKYFTNTEDHRAITKAEHERIKAMHDSHLGKTFIGDSVQATFFEGQGLKKYNGNCTTKEYAKAGLIKHKQ